MKKTKIVDVFNRIPRKIRCIKNTIDYLGDGSLLREEKLVIGELYTLIESSRESYGSVVYIKEVPTRMGIQACMFEELEKYDEDILRKKSEIWLHEKLKATEASVIDDKTYPVEESLTRLKESLEKSLIMNREKRNRNRIVLFLAAVQRLWEEYPDLRFGQLVAHIENDETKRFYLEDDKLLEQIRELIPK